MKKLTFIQTNDIHWKLVNPKARMDIYYEAIGAKLFEIFDLASKLQASGILVAGDLVDSPGIGHDAIRMLGKILIQSPCPIYTIAGQHDEWGHNPESLRRTPYGIIDGFNVIHNVADKAMVNLVGDVPVVISGRDYDTEADVAEDYYEPNYDSFEDVDLSRKPIVIHLAHGTVLTETPVFDRYTLVSQIKTSADVLCVGDYHPGIGVQKVGGTYIVNPGALARVKATETEITRTVQVSVIEVFEDRNIEIKLIPIECAMPGEKVLSRDHIAVEVARNERMDKFLALLASEGESKFLELRDIVEDIAAREMIPDDIKSEALKRIGVAREALGVA